ncbi:hypothetical protein DVP60_21010 [Yersinia enterocolitica]|uniref:hypothetical protein n=1 Tax=Yersinia TaxID=629 RepID=UPI0021E810CA|nr:MULTISPECIES: hypothetical protein [Yersinia]EKN3949046.1 hypothetical protein [Yersinia enterocolitica]EKN6318694.1 hypothetical protein [Yersinia enterocolitica]MDA5544386.1 hypothetical protein [Yersinia rochesterensis]UYJ98515.1 hypothetical protein N4W06_05475 [Yersinia enterocolitica]UZM74048.1 hypothetical protein OP863_13910 [Yersinia sp. SCPM-O-B-9106 (C-191)]
MKIKRVEVQAFRAYLEKANGTFDFMVPGQDGIDVPANFISLYAPNGFGKSSFYDAVEWAMTNGSERFSDGVFEAAARGSKQDDEALRILRNIEAPSDLETSVLVSTTVQDFSRSPGTIRKNSFDVDFKEKKLIEGAEAYRTIFLSQDAIDYFIRGINPEDRYQAFVSIYGEETEIQRREVQAAYLGVGEQIEKCKNAEKKLCIEIEAPVDNHIVERFFYVANELRESGIFLQALPEQMHDTKLDALTKELVTLAAKAQHDLVSIATREQALNELTEGLSSNSTDSAELVLQLAKEQALLDALGKIATRDALLQVQVGNVAEINRYEKDLRRNQSIHSAGEKYRLLYGKKLGLTREVEAENLQLRTIEIRVQQLSTQKSELLKRLTDLQHRKATWDLLKSGAARIYESIEKTTQDQINLNAELSSASTELTLLSTKLKEQTDLLVAITKIPENVYDLGISDLALLGISVDTYSALRAARAENLLIESRLASINLTIQDLESQSNAFGKLAAVAEEILTTHPGHNCPLCQKDHGTFEALKEAIDSNSKLKGILKEKSEQRNTLTTNLVKSKNLLSDKISELLVQRSEVINRLEVDIRSKTDGISSVTMKKSILESRLNSLQQELVSNKAIVLNLSSDQLSIKVNEELKGFSARIETSQVDVNKIEKELEALSLKRTSVIANISEINTSLIGIDADQDYALVLNYLKEFNCALSGNDDDFQTLALNIKLEIDGRKALWSENDSAIKSINEGLKKNDLPLDNLQIKNQLELCGERVTELRSRIESYNSKFISLIGISPVEYPDYEDRLVAAIKNVLTQKRSTNIFDEKLSELRALLEALTPVINRELCRKEMESIVERRIGYESLKEKIGAELILINNVLERQLDTVFQTDLINEIYRKIDPHPNFSQVKFACGFGLKNRPTLNILVKDKESEREISPLLYFSSAQLNILSLSIFLARALNAKSPTGQLLDLILIDDPIHSMDSINVLSTIDLLRGIALNHNKQIVISTHDENFYELLKRKIPAGLCQSRFLKLKSLGQVEVDD